ncbi:hypothetical protein HBB16_10525 [Pseudonocardia sp. MCCB 268]|nr:hypothetical protein [Pseudonocardia cytotoxica]
MKRPLLERADLYNKAGGHGSPILKEHYAAVALVVAPRCEVAVSCAGRRRRACATWPPLRDARRDPARPDQLLQVHQQDRQFSGRTHRDVQQQLGLARCRHFFDDVMMTRTRSRPRCSRTSRFRDRFTNLQFIGLSGMQPRPR